MKRFEKILNKAVACQLTGSMSVYMTMSVHNTIFEAGLGLNGSASSVLADWFSQSQL